MLHVFICEDNPTHNDQLKKCVENCILIHNLTMKIALSAESPVSIIEHLKMEQGAAGLYFLDIDLQHDINGLRLAETIREYDPRGFIVFVTTHSEALPLTFQYKVEAMDFILKDEFYEFQSKVHACILNAHKRYTAKATELQRNFTFNVFDKLYSIAYTNIFYLESSPSAKHKILIHTADGVFEFYGVLSKLILTLDHHFYRCHHSYIINTQQEFWMDTKQQMIYFKKGFSCPISSRNIRPLTAILQNKKGVAGLP